LLKVVSPGLGARRILSDGAHLMPAGPERADRAGPGSAGPHHSCGGRRVEDARTPICDPLYRGPSNRR